MRIKILFLLTTFLFLPGLSLYAGEGRQEYSLAIENAKSSNPDFAFMYFREILEKYPDSPYAQKSRFACGEYYYQVADYEDAFKMFKQYSLDYPASGEIQFVLAYLLEIARKKGDDSLAGKIEKDIITSRRLSFLFRDLKEYKYRSSLYKLYRAVYYIDKVEFYIDGELFVRISY